MTLPLRTMAGLCALGLAVCAKSVRPVPRTPDTSPIARLAADASVDGGGAEALAPEVHADLASVVESVRRDDLHTAWSLWQRLPALVQQSPAGRYLGARLALSHDDFAAPLPLLHDLGALVPSLSIDIARREADALARLDRHAESRAAYEALASRNHSERDRAMAAEQAALAGDDAGAARTMHAWSSDPPSGLDRARAWRDAGRALEATGDRDGAVRAWVRVVVDEPDTSAVAEARLALARLGHALTVDEVLARAEALDERARHDDAAAELTVLGVQSGSRETRRLHLLGRALFGARGHYAEAQRALALAIARPDAIDRDHDAFLAARAFARSDQDDAAVRAYDGVARTYRGRWSDEAAFRAAQIVSHGGAMEDAVSRWHAFLRDRSDATDALRDEGAWELAWLLFRHGRNAEAAEAFAHAGSVASHGLEKGRGRYWQGIAQWQGGDHAAALATWRALVGDRPLTWYALLATARLRASDESVPNVPAPAPARPTPPFTWPSDVTWLHALGFDREAGRALALREDEMRGRLPADRADEMLARAYVDLGEAHRAYTIAQRHGDLLDAAPDARTRWVWDCAYPRPYAPLVEAAEDAAGLPRDYLFAIMRQESAFNDRDVSTARAIGLLQMIPPTTRRVARELGIEYREDLLFEPAYNIRVAGHYIGRLFAQYHGVLPRSIGAFNAGPGAMNRWIHRSDSPVETDAFVESIPFDETRTYVRRVTQNLARYRYLHGPAATVLELPLRSDAPVESLVEY